MDENTRDTYVDTYVWLESAASLTVSIILLALTNWRYPLVTWIPMPHSVLGMAIAVFIGVLAGLIGIVATHVTFKLLRLPTQFENSFIFRLSLISLAIFGFTAGYFLL